MSKKSKKRELEIKRNLKKGVQKSTRKRYLTEKQKSEIEKLINAPRAAHHKNEKLFYDEFHDLEFQRLGMADALKKSLLKETENKFEFNAWVRCVSYLYSNQPLSSRGSVNSTGGRFNIGKDISESNFTAFNALYLAENQPTALMEKFGVANEGDLGEAMEACFAKQENTSCVFVSGILHNVLDIDKASSLNEFVRLISKVKKSHDIVVRRKAQGFKPGGVIKDVPSLKDSLYDSEWRYSPEVLDLPSNSQIFGQLAFRAGVEAIIYTSVKNKKRCLAVFPTNLGEKSYVEIIGAVPGTVNHRRLDSKTCGDLI